MSDINTNTSSCQKLMSSCDELGQYQKQFNEFEFADFGNIFNKAELQMIDSKSPVTVSIKNNDCVAQRLSSVAESSTTMTEVNENFGHLLNFSEFFNEYYNRETNNYTNDFDQIFDNQVLLTQSENLSLTNLVTESILQHADEKMLETISYKTSQDLFQCRWSGCGKELISLQALVYHIEKIHINSCKSDKFICLWQPCPRHSKPFNARYKLLIHMRVHSGEKPNKCSFPNCTKAFSRLENLKIHQRSHTGEKPYICQFAQCSKAFSNSSDRAKHQRTHYDQKPYACQMEGCTKKYTDPSSLRKHFKNHTSPISRLKKQLKSPEDILCSSTKQDSSSILGQQNANENILSDQNMYSNLVNEAEFITVDEYFAAKKFRDNVDKFLYLDQTRDELFIPNKPISSNDFIKEEITIDILKQSSNINDPRISSSLFHNDLATFLELENLFFTDKLETAYENTNNIDLFPF